MIAPQAYEHSMQASPLLLAAGSGRTGAVHDRRRRRLFFCSALAGALVLAFWTGAATSARAQNIALQTASGGVTISGSNPNWLAGFGNVNGLGLGTPGAGVSLITSGVSGGVLYTTPYTIHVAGAGGGNRAVVRAYVSTNFTHPAILQLQSCYPAASCSTASSYTILPTSAAAEIDVISIPGVLNANYDGSLGLFVSNLSGAGAFAGADSATITLHTYAWNGSVLQLKDTDTLTLNSPSENVQTAVQLLLASAGGITISPASDFSTSFGSVNGLGIGPAPGLTVTGVGGGVLYRTPYSIQPTFASFSSATGTVKVYVSTDFGHPTILELRDSPDNVTYTAISKLVGSQTNLTSTAASTTPITRYLGLFVSNSNGLSAFTGADSAILTYTLMVP